MPQILDLGENGIHELPDDATPEEIQSFADGFNPKPQHDWRLDPQPSLTQSLAERMTPPALTKLPTKPQSPQFTPGVPTLSITPEQIAANDEASRQMLDEVSVARMAGIHPNRVMSGKEMSDASGVSPVITTPVSAVMKTGAGIANFLTSPRGVGESAVAATPAGPAVLTKWAYDMLKSGAESLVDIKDAIAQRLDEELAQSMTAGGGRQRDQSEFHQRLAEDAVNSAAGLYFGTKIGKGVATDAIVKTAPQLMPKTALAREIEKAPLTGKLQVDEAARLRSQLPPKAAPQEMLPEVARTQELVDQAIQEATQKIVDPNKVSALELLRRQAQDLIQVEPTASKIPGGGEAVGGKLTFNRPAEQQAEGRTQELGQPKESPNAPLQTKVEEVRQSERQGTGEVGTPPEAVGSDSPASGGSAKKAKVDVGPIVDEITAIEKKKNKTQKDEARLKELRDQFREHGFETITPENDTPIGKNAAGEQLYQRKDGSVYRMRNDRASRPNGYPDFGGDLAQVEASAKSPADLDAALQARGYGDIKRSKMTPEEKAAAAAEPIPTPEADAARFWEMNDAIKAEKDFAKKSALYKQFGDEMELIKNRNPKDSGNPPERPASEAKKEKTEAEIDDAIQILEDSIQTKKANKQEIPSAWINKLAALKEQKSTGEKPSSEYIATRSDIYGHPENSPDLANPILPLKVKADSTGLQTIESASKEAQRIREKVIADFNKSKGASKELARSRLLDIDGTQREISRLQKEVEAAIGNKTPDLIAKLNALKVKGPTGEAIISKPEAAPIVTARQVGDTIYVQFDKRGGKSPTAADLTRKFQDAGHNVQFQEMAQDIGSASGDRVKFKGVANDIGGAASPRAAEAAYKSIFGNEPIIAKTQAEGKIPTRERLQQALTPDLISKLNALKVKGPTGENLHNVFSTKAIAEIGKQLWNDAIDVAIAAVKAGRSAKSAIAEAISHIKRNARNYDEVNLRAGLEQILKDEGLDARVSRTPVVAEGAGSAHEVVSETASKGIESPEGQKPRKFSARATTSERIPEQVQEQIRTDERSSYTPQEVPVVRDTVKGMSDAELGAMTTDNAMFTEGKAELADRLFKAGKDQAGLDVIQNASVELTRLGQIINQAKLLNSIAPESQILVINEGLKKAGKDPLTEAQRGKVLELGRQGRVAKGELDKATEAWQKDPTPENAKKADEALDNKNKIDLELQKFTNAFQPKTYASLIKAILQGNLLTPISQTANIVGNLSFLPFRAATRSVASGLDFLESAITGRPRTSTVGPISGTVEAAKGLARGAEKIPGILYRGTGNTILGEKRAGIQPIKAWMNQFAESPDIPTTGGKLTVNDRIKLLIEGTMGVAPEMMLRGLGAGDAPFKEAARGRVIANQLRLAKVPKARWEMAQKFPELFFNKEKLDQIHKETLAAVFQRESKTLSLLTHWIAGKGELFDLAVATVAPYKVTPWNIIGEILSYNPVVAFSRGVYEAKQKNVRGINENAAKFLVGSALTAAGTLLYKNGLLSPSLDSKDETMKERILSQQVMPPNHLNISGLKRMRSGGDPKFQPGDQTVDVFRSGGLAGAFFYMTANIGRSLEKSPQGDTTDLLGAIGSQSTLEQARFGLNQSFLSGVEGLLTSVKDGNTDNYVKQWASTVTSIPLPNTLSTLSRATRDFKPDFRADGFKGKIENIIRNRLGFAGLDDYLPLKRDFWGDPIPETPKDKSALFYQFFDVSKGQQITSDPKSIELYRLWRKTDDSKIIPTPVEKNQTFGDKTYILTPKQQEDLAIKVGELRKQAVDSLVVNPEWHKLPDEQKASILQRVYNRGLEFGKGKFYVENKDALEAKPKKAGFITP